MGEDNKTILGPGTLYIAGEPHPLGEVRAVEALAEEPAEEPNENLVLKIGPALQASSVTCTITAETFVAMSRALVGYVYGTLFACPNRRVVHLAKHSKKRRTRKKNWHRACRIVEREAGR